MILLLTALLTSVSGAAEIASNSILSDHDAYAKLFPVHAEYCAGTELTFIGGVQGGLGGHGFTYVEGLCKDMSKAYPQVKVCDEGDAYTGVGVSVNSDFDNVNWVAIPGYNFFLNGTVGEGQAVSKAVMDATADRANALHIFDNIFLNKPELTRVNGVQTKPGTPEYLHAAAINSIGTDYATRFGRNLECVRVPFPRENLVRIAKVLNDLNNSYYPTSRTGKHYKWDGVFNNCAHVASEILAAAGVRKAIPKEQSYLKQARNMAIPKNGVYTLIDNGIRNDESPWRVFQHKAERVSILSSSPFLVHQPGVLALRYAAHSDNSVFKLDSKALWILQSRGNVYADRLIFGDVRYSNLRENLRMWSEILAQKEAELAEPSFLESARAAMNAGSGDAYGDFRKAYGNYLEKLARLVDENKGVDSVSDYTMPLQP